VFEYHGWLIIRAAPHETDTDYRDVHAAVDFLKDLVEVDAGAPGLRDIRWVNGSPQYHFGGFRNRSDGVYRSALESVERVLERAPGSYGVIYYWDDEDPVHPNEFRVLVVRRGKITEHADTFLSPVVPTIEDPYLPDEP
jgi:hypothetical protein